MGLVLRALERRSSLTNPDPWLADYFGGGVSSVSGQTVDEERAMRASAVWACVRILAQSVASLPCIVYEPTSNGRRRAVDHPLYTLLHDRPNSSMSPFQFFEAAMVHTLLYGNAFVEKIWTVGGTVKELWPLRPTYMTVERNDDGTPRYIWNGETDTPLPPEKIVHVPGMGFDGIVGCSPIRQVREAVGLSLATEDYGARFFANDARPGGVLEHPGAMSEEAYQRLRRDWEAMHRGSDKAHRMAILEEGLKFHEVGVPPEDAQYLETRRFQVAEICRIYGVPPHMVADVERSTSWGTGIEAQAVGFLTYSLRPWLVRFEQALRRQLFTPADVKAGLIIEFLVEGLLRADTKTRYDAYAVGRTWGWLSVNDIRRIENLDSIDNGDVYLQPLNMIPAGEDIYQAKAMPAAPAGDDERAVEMRKIEVRDRAASRLRIVAAHRGLFTAAWRRIFRRAQTEIAAASKKLLPADTNGFRNWLEAWLVSFRAYMTLQLAPVVQALGESVGVAAASETGGEAPTPEQLAEFTRKYVSNVVEREVSKTRTFVVGRINQASEQGVDVNAALAEELDSWDDDEGRAGWVARDDSSEAGWAFAKFAWTLAGIIALRWVTVGDSCPICREMDGRVVSVEKSFVSSGGVLAGYTSSRDVGHPPLHDGCDCQVVPDITR